MPKAPQGGGVTNLPLDAPVVSVIATGALRDGEWLLVGGIGLIFVAPDRLAEAIALWPVAVTADPFSGRQMYGLVMDSDAS
jgi:hypothetical protein